MRTPTAPSPIRAVEREAAATRERGYAIEDGEYRAGVRALAAPVHDGARATIAAIAVSTSGNVDVEALSDDVTRAAAKLSSALATPAVTAARTEERLSAAVSACGCAFRATDDAPATGAANPWRGALAGSVTAPSRTGAQAP